MTDYELICVGLRRSFERQKLWDHIEALKSEVKKAWMAIVSFREGFSWLIGLHTRSAGVQEGQPPTFELPWEEGID